MNYYEWPFDYGGDLKIVCNHPRSEAVKRVAEVTRHVTGCMPIAFSVSRVDGSQLVGEVTDERVVVARARPFLRDGSKPVFYGSFASSEDRVILKGRFGVSCWQKVAFWATLVTAGAIEAILIVVTFFASFSPESPGLLNSLGLVLAIPAIGIVVYTLTSHWHRKFIREDRDWIEEELRKALGQ